MQIAPTCKERFSSDILRGELFGLHPDSTGKEYNLNEIEEWHNSYDPWPEQRLIFVDLSFLDNVLQLISDVRPIKVRSKQARKRALEHQAPI